MRNRHCSITYTGKRDLLYRLKRPSIQEKETYQEEKCQ
jgi:hypothetical protein